MAGKPWLARFGGPRQRGVPYGFMKWLAKFGIPTSFALALAVLALFAGAAWRSASRNLQMFHQIGHSNRMEDALDNILVESLNIETGERGFLVSGNEKFLEPYAKGVASIDQALATARNLAQNNPLEQDLLATLERLIAQKREFVDKAIRLRRQGNAHGASQLVATGRGKELMDQIGSVIADLKSKEDERLELSMARFESEAHWTIVIVSVSGLLAVALVASAGMLVRRDLRRRQEAEAALQYASERLSLAARAGKVGFWEWNILDGTVFWDEGMYPLYGVARDKFSPTFAGFIASLHPDDRRRVQDSVQAALRGEKEYGGEFRVVWPDNSVHYIQANSVILRDAAGWPARMLGTNWDVTGRRLEEEKFRQLLESAPDGMLIANPEGEMTLVNAQMEQLFGYSRDELTGTPVERLIPERFRAAHPAHRRTFLAAPKTRPMGADRELKGLRKDGTEFPVEIALSPLQTEAGMLVIAAIRDVTERKKAEETLREKEEVLRTLTESMPQFVWICRPDGWNVYFNQRWFDYTGMTCEESLGHGWNKPFHPDDQLRAWNAWKQATETGGKYDLECRLRRADGNYRWFLIRGVPLRDASGKILKWFGTCTDIDDRKKAEEEITVLNAKLGQHSASLEAQVSARTAELRESVKSLETLNYTMAHDLRAPIRGMTAYTDALQEDVPLDETGKGYVREIHKAADRMNELINDLLDYGQLAHLAFPLVAVDLRVQIAKALDLLAPEVRRTNAEVQVMEPIPVVFGNSGLLDRILSNLLANALKFVAPGVTPRVVFRGETRDSTARLWVEDNGLGIAPAYQERIFGVFQRLHTVEEYPGTGVGLAICQRCIELMKGRIGVESAEGKGSRFWIELPLVGDQQRDRGADL